MKALPLAEFLTFLPELIAEVRHAEWHALEECAQIVEKEAKAEIGHYQGDAGPFVAWAPLADTTVWEKERLGYAPPDNPLLRTGELLDSIEHTVPFRQAGEMEAQIGSNNDVAVYQELGTKSIPPRSFLGGAAVRSAHHVVEVIGDRAVRALAWDHVHKGRIQIS